MGKLNRKKGLEPIRLLLIILLIMAGICIVKPEITGLFFVGAKTIVHAKNAIHLDENYGFISNIFDEIEHPDSNWSEPIYKNKFVRVIFEANLTNGSVIDVYARNLHSTNTWFEVYYANTTSPLLGTSKIFNSTGEWDHIVLSNIPAHSDQFDFKIINNEINATGFLEFDYIHDETVNGTCIVIEAADKAGPVAATCTQVNAADDVYAGGGLLDCKALSCYVNTTHNASIPDGATINSAEAIIEWGVLNGGNVTISVFKNSTQTWHVVDNTNYIISVTEAQFTYNLSQWINTVEDARESRLLFLIEAVGLDPKLSYDMVYVNVIISSDALPPASVTNLANQSAGETWIYWNWTNPADSDFSENIIYLDSVWKQNTSNNYYNATGLSPNTNYTITVHTKDTSGNINDTDVNNTASTLVSLDTTPPASVTNLANQSAGETWIYWNWTNPVDADFNESLIYISGVNVVNTSNNEYNATGLGSGLNYTITVHTKDHDGNVNDTDVNSTASTAGETDTTPPNSITNLQNQSAGTSWIYWNWTNPADADFSENIIYLDSVWKQNTSNNYYNATGLTPNTNYTITVHTKDTSGNINDTDVNNTASTLVSLDTIPPAITFTYIYPYAVVTGQNATLNMTATDNVNISATWAEITLPNSSIEAITTFPSDYITEINGRHNITFYANDTSGNQATETDYAIAGTAFNLTLNVKGYTGADVNTTLVIYLAGTNKKVQTYNFTGTLNQTSASVNYDLLFTALNGSISIQLNKVNLSKYNNKTLGLDKRAAATAGYLVTYGITSGFNQSNAIITIDYSGVGFSNENYLELYRCADWNFTQQTCEGTWAELTTATQDKTANTFAITLSELSGFSIKQEAVPSAPEPAPAERDGARCTTIWNCTGWSACLPNETQTRECVSVGTCRWGNKTETQNCTYITPEPVEEEIPKPPAEKPEKLYLLKAISLVKERISYITNFMARSFSIILISLREIINALWVFTVTNIVLTIFILFILSLIIIQKQSQVARAPEYLKAYSKKEKELWKKTKEEKKDTKRLKTEINKNKKFERESRNKILNMEIAKKENLIKMRDLASSIEQDEEELRKILKKREDIWQEMLGLESLGMQEKVLEDRGEELTKIIPKNEIALKRMGAKLKKTNLMVKLNINFMEELKRINKHNKKLIKKHIKEIVKHRELLDKIVKTKAGINKSLNKFKTKLGSLTSKKERLDSDLFEFRARLEKKSNKLKKAGIMIPKTVLKQVIPAVDRIKSRINRVELSIENIKYKKQNAANEKAKIKSIEKFHLRKLVNKKKGLKELQKKADDLGKKSGLLISKIDALKRQVSALEIFKKNAEQELINKISEIKNIRSEKADVSKLVPVENKKLSEKEKNFKEKENKKLDILKNKRRRLRGIEKEFVEISKKEFKLNEEVKKKSRDLLFFASIIKQKVKDTKKAKRKLNLIKYKKKGLTEKAKKTLTKEIAHDIEKLNKKSKR